MELLEKKSCHDKPFIVNKDRGKFCSDICSKAYFIQTLPNPE